MATRSLALVLAIGVLALSPAHAKHALAAQGEAKVAKLIAGRTAGMPVGCIDTAYRIPDGLQVIDGVGVVYDAGKTIYLARATHPETLRWTDRAAVDRADPMRLCAGDRILTRDRETGLQTGVVFLQDFVPYTKAD
jgi:hypothetical protein